MGNLAQSISSKTAGLRFKLCVLAVAWTEMALGVAAIGKPWRGAIVSAESTIGRSIDKKLSAITALQPVHAALPEYAIPVRGRISSVFLEPRPGHLHAGIDIATNAGTAIVATKDGIVISAGPMGNYGLTVDIDHGNGIMSRSTHQSRIVVSAGQAVKAGQHIGDIGSTGNATGPTLHFEIRLNGNPVDPLPLLGIDSSKLTIQSTASPITVPFPTDQPAPFSV